MWPRTSTAARRYRLAPLAFSRVANSAGVTSHESLFLQRDTYNNALDNLNLSQDPLTGNRYALAASNPVNYVELDGHVVVSDEIGGISAADLPKSNVAYGASIATVAVSEAERAARLARLTAELGCTLASGRATTGCQALLLEFSRARGAAAKAAAALGLNPSLLPAVPWIAAAVTGGFTVRFAGRAAPRVISMLRKVGPKAAEAGLNVVLKAAAKVGAWAVEPHAMGTCIRKSVGVVTGPSRLSSLLEAIPRCLEVALKR